MARCSGMLASVPKPIEGAGVIAFHDYDTIGSAISAFVRENWRDITYALAFAGGVFALEMGGGGLLRHPAVEGATASRWHSALWNLVNRPSSPRPLLAAWSALPSIDKAIFKTKRRLRMT